MTQTEHALQREDSGTHTVMTSATLWAGALSLALVTLLFSILALLAIPTLPFDRNRRVVHFIVNRWARSFAFLAPGLSYHIVGVENLPPRHTPSIYVANHQSLIDIPLLYLLDRPVRFIAKRSLFSIPVFGWALWAVGIVPVRRDSNASGKTSYQSMVATIRAGFPVAIFPEGTRTRNGRLQMFRGGAFRLAMETGAPLVPISISGGWHYLPRGTLVPRRARVTIQVHPAIQAGGSTLDTLRASVQQVIEKGTAPIDGETVL